MTVNPFELFQNLQKVQARMGEMQEKLKGIRVSGASGGDMVRVELSGAFEVLGVHISAEAVDPADTKLLEDLVLAAITDAVNRLKERIRDEVAGAAGLGGLPTGMLGL